MNSSNPVNKENRPENGKGSHSVAEHRYTCSLIEGEVQRHTYYARADLLEKLRGYAYWERIGISELINQILEEFFEGKEVKPTPRQKRG